MAERTLLQIVTAACDELALPRPTAVVGSSDAQTQQMLALLTREGRELAARDGPSGGWPRLVTEYEISVLSGTDNYAFPSDIQYFVNTTAWDRTNDWPLQGPISPQVWQVLKSGTIGSVGPRTRFRLKAGRIYLDPSPTANATAVFEYYSNSWCESTGGTAQSAWAADSDKPRLPDDCFILGLIWRWRRAKGLDYQEEFNTYEDCVTRNLARASMAPILSLDGPNYATTRFIDEDNLPDTGYGGV